MKLLQLSFRHRVRQCVKSGYPITYDTSHQLRIQLIFGSENSVESSFSLYQLGDLHILNLSL